MKIKKGSPGTRSQPDEKQGKKVYRAPRLNRHGTLKDLTAGAAGPVTDGGLRQPS